ncbi:unnamed protein product [Larinioides sclopetarius]|uniref:Protein sleepless n=1 Tax=Larinioides sclopetarius TaxID=280406 RepID=A0AAV2BPI0_9ARAC
MTETILPIAFLLVGFSLQFGEGLRCWECNSKYDPNCGEPFKGYTISLVDCSQRFLKQNMDANATICRKITQKVQGETRIIRSCGYYDPESAGTCFSRAGTHLVFMHYCQCAGEGCNKSSPLSAPPALLLAFVLTLVFLAPKLRIDS